MMTYEPLHHKYRPQIFNDLVGQEAISMTLINALNREKIAPAYLFTGPRGTGKTSSARILAKSLNCLNSDQPTPTPCGQCEVCKAIARGSALDVIEIDAASNTGVDNIREIIERSQFAPVQCRYKVYVIDECHMLSVAAFNALLKTLEEPPKHVIFVLATTDPQRVLPTIISRCQRFDYRRIPLEAMVNHLSYIARQEKIDIEPEALTLVAQIANGGLRDAESLLDQLSLLAGTISPERVWELVGTVPEKDLLTLLQAIHSDNAEAVLEQCRHLMNRGREPLVVLQNLASFYLNLLVAQTAPKRSDLVAVTASTWEALSKEAQQWTTEEILRGQQHLKESELQIKNTTQPRLWLEVTLLGLLPSALSHQVITEVMTPQQPGSNSRPQTTPPLVATPPVVPEDHLPPQPQLESLSPPVTPLPVAPVVNGTPIEIPQENQQIWQKLLQHLHPVSTQQLLTQHGHLLSFNDKSATVGCKAPGLMNLLNMKRPDIEAAFQVICGRPIAVTIELVDRSTSTPPSPPSERANPKFSPNSIPPLSEQNPINSNDSQPRVSASFNPETNGKHMDNSLAVLSVSLPQQRSLSEINPVLPQTSETSTQKEQELFRNSSDEELQKIVENFAKVFEGEIVTANFEKEEESLTVKNILSSQKEAIKNADYQPQSSSDVNLSQPQEQTINQESKCINPTSTTPEKSTEKPRIVGRPEILDDDDF
jgi:DNA polymerase-3 subunit gamma/tau